MEKFNRIKAAVGTALLAGPVAVQAAVPVYVSTALANAQTTLTEYLEAAAPMVFAVVTIIASIFLIVRMVKRAAS